MGTAPALDEEIGPTTRRITWQLTQANPDGEWARLPDYPDKAIHIAGNFDAATVKLQGSSLADKSHPVTLKDTFQALVSTTQDLAAQITENLEHFRPSATGAGATMNVTVVAICRGTRR